MLKIRLQRVGRKNDPSYRVVVVDSRSGPKTGKHIDLLGSYNPKTKHMQIEGEKVKEWIAKGAQVSDTMHNILVSEKIIEGTKINVLPKKSPVIKEDEVIEKKEDTQTKKEEETKASASEDTGEEKGQTDATTDATNEGVKEKQAFTPEEKVDQKKTTEEVKESSKKDVPEGDFSEEKKEA